MKSIVLLCLLALIAGGQQITPPGPGWTPNSDGTYNYNSLGEHYPEFGPDSEFTPVMDYFTAAFLSSDAQISGINNNVIKLLTFQKEQKLQNEGVAAEILALKANQRTTGSGGGAVAVPSLDAVLSVSPAGIAPDKGITVKTLDTTGNITSSSGSVIANILTARSTITTTGPLLAGYIDCGSGINAGGKITGVAEPTAGTDAATKGYVDNAVTNVGNQEVIVYMLSGSTSSDTFSLVPVRLMGVKLGGAVTGGEITFTRKDITETIGISNTEITSRKFSGFVVNATSSGAGTAIPLIDHGSFPQ